ncbi:hypothetical protein ABW21_db0209458 [Orbilia brochopaga]|nr:hypothetical protein ABW21_db0209458 [Drechslerella brochopaga]
MRRRNVDGDAVPVDLQETKSNKRAAANAANSPEPSTSTITDSQLQAPLGTCESRMLILIPLAAVPPSLTLSTLQHLDTLEADRVSKDVDNGRIVRPRLLINLQGTAVHPSPEPTSAASSQSVRHGRAAKDDGDAGGEHQDTRGLAGRAFYGRD